MKILDDLINQIHQRYPELVSCIQEKDGTLIFFNEYGLPRVSVIIKSIRGPNVVVDLFEYDKKLAKGNS